MKKLYYSIIQFTVIIAAAVGMLVWIAGPDRNSANDLSDDVNQPIDTNLTVDEPFFDFGNVSMAVGIVTHEFKIKNAGTSETTVNQIYTSCMCTEASFIKGDTKLGPFGMAGHGFIPKINGMIGAGEEAVIKVDFDPAAHGPAGVGPVDRVVYIFQKGSSQPIELQIKALVTP